MYNCEKQITRVLSKFNEDIQSLFSEILAVDNGSRDKTLEVAEQALKKLEYIKTTLVQNSDNYSLGGSHKVAFNYALANNYDYVVVLHGDDQGSIEDLIPYIKNCEYQNYDSTLGARFTKGSKLVGYSLIRILGNWALNAFCSLVTGRWVLDMGSGLNMYKTSYLKDKFYLYFPNTLAYNVYMLFYGIHTKSRFKFFPLTWREDDQVSNAKIFDVGFKILKLIMIYIFQRKQLFSKQPNQFSVIEYKSRTVFQQEARMKI
jgi:glycosyltransferase involved in cell wall biosynthesis